MINTHNLDEAEKICNQVALIKNKLIKVGTPRDLARGLFASAIRITLENIPNSILSEISALGIVSNARIENNQLILNVDDPKKDNNKIINWLIKKGLKVQFVSEDEYSLEDVYLKLIDEEGT